MKTNHEVNCDLCGQVFDIRSLAQVVEHQHTGSDIQVDPSIQGVRVQHPTFADRFPKFLCVRIAKYASKNTQDVLFDISRRATSEGFAFWSDIATLYDRNPTPTDAQVQVIFTKHNIHHR